MFKAFSVCEEGAGRLDRFLKKNVPVAYRALMRAVRCGDVKVNGKRGRVDTVVSVGDSVQIYGLAFEEKTYTPITDKDSAFVHNLCIYEDEHVWVCAKPPGLAVQRGSGIRRSLDVLVHGVGVQKGGTPWRLVHRIDKPTSGVVVCAKNRTAAQELTALFRTQKVEKHYMAIVEGCMYGAGTLRQRIGQASACTHYRVMASVRDYTLLRVQPVTGRKRQIRHHFLGINHPVVGDGHKGCKGFLALHALSVSFLWRNTRFVWMATPPEAFHNFMRAAGLS